MKKRMRNRIISRIAWGFAILFLIMVILNNYIDYRWEKQNADIEANNEFLVQKALDTGNIRYCDGHNYKLKCVVLVAMKYNDTKVCETAFFNGGGAKSTMTACKAHVLGNAQICDELESKASSNTCESIYYSLKGDLENKQHEIWYTSTGKKEIIEKPRE